MVAERKDAWASGHAYEPHVGRWSRLVARQFVDWLGVPPSSDWIDVGCGTGALSEVILASASPRQVTGIDPSDGFVAFARKHVADPRASFRVGDAQALPLASHSFDAAVAGLVINFVADQAKAIGEMRRATRPDGVVAAYVWDYAGAIQMMRAFWDAAAALDPNAVALDEGRRFPVCHPEPLVELFADAGLKDVAVRASMCRRCSKTSTITGRPFLAVRPRRRDIACRFPKIVVPYCASAFGRACPSTTMAASI